MIITKNTTLEDLQYLSKGEPLKITKDVSLDSGFFSFLLENFPESEITILTGYNKYSHYYSNNELYTEQETLILAENVNVARKFFNKDVLFDGGFTVEEAIVASEKINTIVGDISSARLNEKPLSALEKFLWAYKETTNHFYKKEDEDESSAISRDLISILNGDKIVCAGFANMLFTLCNRLNIPCTLQPLIVGGKKPENHMACAVRIDDDKYGIHGIFHSDPTFDCAKTNRTSFGKESFNFALVPYKHLDMVYNHGYVLDHFITEDKDIGSIEEGFEQNIISEHKKILSYLFPEKTHGLSQNEILKQQAESSIKQLGIDKKIEECISSINQNSAEFAYEAHLKNLFNPSSFFNTKNQLSFIDILDARTQELIFLGFSKQEISSMFKQQFSDERLIPELETWCEQFEKKDTPEYKALFEDTFLRTKKYLPVLGEVLDSFDFEKEEKLNPFVELKNFANTIVRECVEDSVSSKNQKHGSSIQNSMYVIGYLLKNGFPIDKLKLSLKYESEAIDISKILYACKDIHLKNFYLSNENDFYLSQDFSTPIYNEPYEDDFLKLSNSATPPSMKVFYHAMLNICLSQGYPEGSAKRLAKKTLRPTTFPFERFSNSTFE